MEATLESFESAKVAEMAAGESRVKFLQHLGAPAINRWNKNLAFAEQDVVLVGVPLGTREGLLLKCWKIVVAVGSCMQSCLSWERELKTGCNAAMIDRSSWLREKTSAA